MVNEDKEVIELQIGRPLRSSFTVSCRCHLDLPAVIKVPPKLDDSTPFPTTYWLSCPMMNKKIGALESQGLIKALDKELQDNSQLKSDWLKRQESYKNEREDLDDQNSYPKASGGVGGAENSIKCLHSHTADELSTGLNPIGKIVLESIGSFNCDQPCISKESMQKNEGWSVVW